MYGLDYSLPAAQLNIENHGITLTLVLRTSSQDLPDSFFHMTSISVLLRKGEFQTHKEESHRQDQSNQQ